MPTASTGKDKINNTDVSTSATTTIQSTTKTSQRVNITVSTKLIELPSELNPSKCKTKIPIDTDDDE